MCHTLKINFYEPKPLQELPIRPASQTNDTPESAAFAAL
jgi:hypothetical protein